MAEEMATTQLRGPDITYGKLGAVRVETESSLVTIEALLDKAQQVRAMAINADLAFDALIYGGPPPEPDHLAQPSDRLEATLDLLQSTSDTLARLTAKIESRR